MGWLILLGFIIAIIWAIWSDEIRRIKDEEAYSAKRKKEYAEDKAWLDEELKKPIYCVVFETNDKVVRFSVPYEPKLDPHWSGDYNSRFTSKKIAEDMLLDMYEDGFFTDKFKITYPACNVVCAFIREAIL